MLKKEFIITLLVVFVSFGFVTAVFAENSETSLLGTDEFNFNAQKTSADVAAQNHVYNQENLAKVGTEAGNWVYDFDAPVTAADNAARYYAYDHERLERIGTEAGDWEQRSEPSSNPMTPPYVKEEVKTDKTQG